MSLGNLPRRTFVAALDVRNRSRSPQEVFSGVYRRNLWGGRRGEVHSGAGSHRPELVVPYVAVIQQRLLAVDPQAEGTLVDLGCGDFSVGSQFLGMSSDFLACDVVPSVVQRNRVRFAHAPVRFEMVDLVADPLPSADTALLRQVLQHLSNAQIAAILPKLAGYRRVFITEHQPSEASLRRANRDKVHGPSTRELLGSGVFLDREPFGLPAPSLTLLLEVPLPAPVVGARGWLRTWEYYPHS